MPSEPLFDAHDLQAASGALVACLSVLLEEAAVLASRPATEQQISQIGELCRESTALVEALGVIVRRSKSTD